MRERGIACLSAQGLTFLALLLYLGSSANALHSPSPAGLAAVNRVRKGMGIDASTLENVATPQRKYGRPVEEIEGWRPTENGDRWPVDQATFDTGSHIVVKYVIFNNYSRRKEGDPILPMSSVSMKADGYAALLYPDQDLSLEGIDRYGIRGKQSIYYELKYSSRAGGILYLHPLVRMLVNASTGKLYRSEMAVDLLDAQLPRSTMMSAQAAGRVAARFLRTHDLTPYLDNGSTLGSFSQADLFFVRPNSWLGAKARESGKVVAAWVVPFWGGNKDVDPHLLFVKADSGKIVGGIKAQE